MYYVRDVQKVNCAAIAGAYDEAEPDSVTVDSA